MSMLKRLLAGVDGWQRHVKPLGATYGVAKKFGDDNANLLVVSLGWYGFTAIFPLLLVVVTIFGFIGQKSLGTGIVSTLHRFPVVGENFNPAQTTHSHGSVLGLVIGLLGLIYGAQGVTQCAQQAMAVVWNVPQYQRAGFAPWLARSLVGLGTIGGAFLVSAFASTYATGATGNLALRVAAVGGLVVFNAALYLATFRALTPKQIGARTLLPGSVAGGAAFTLLITVGTGLITHQLKNTSDTYGTFGSVIGIVAFLLLLGKLSLYAAELNPVLARRLYPRAMPFGDPTEADHRALRDLVYQEQRRKDQSIGVGFGPDSPDEAARDARRRAGSKPVSARRGRRNAGRSTSAHGRVAEGQLE